MMNEAINPADQDKFLVKRASAMQAYASLEHALCRVFSYLSGASVEVAAVIFFKIPSAHARKSISIELMRIRHGSSYQRFWKSTLNAIDKTNDTRNFIVHWTLSIEGQITTEGISQAEPVLRPPAFWPRMERAARRIKHDDLTRFVEECDFFYLVCNVFYGIVSNSFTPRLPPALEIAWRDVFCNKIKFPIPEGSLLPEVPVECRIPPFSFGPAADCRR
jgi:hypothetical protein